MLASPASRARRRPPSSWTRRPRSRPASAACRSRRRTDPDTAGRLHGLAFVLDFSDAEPPPALAGATPHGWWYLRDADGHPPGRIGLGALLAGRRFVDVHLLRRLLGGMTETLEEGALRVVIVSPEATRERILGGSADWPMHHACRLAAGSTLAPRPAPVLPPSRPAPGWQLRLARYRNTLRRAVELSRDEAWTVGVIDAPAASLVGGFDPARVRWLPSLPGGFVADPMVLPDGEAPAFCLAEGYRFGEDKGFLLRLPLDAEGGRAARPVLSEPFHLSYPHLIRHEGRIYCLPEMAAARRVQLYRADPWPDRWLPDRILIDGFAGADSTLLRHEGRWWLFTTDNEDDANLKLHLFHAPDLAGPWTPHATSPVKADLRGSRPAGPLFTAGGDLIRPAQDCTTTYGAAVVLHRVLRLTPDEYAEEPVARLAPDPRGPLPHGLHTLTAAGPVTLVDGKRHFWRAKRLLDQLPLPRRAKGDILTKS